MQQNVNQTQVCMYVFHCHLSVCMQATLQKEVSGSKQIRRNEQQSANKKAKLSTEPSKPPAALAAPRRSSLSKTDTASQTQTDARPRQVGDYDRPWRAFMKTGGSDKDAEQQKQADVSQPAKAAVKPAARATVNISASAYIHSNTVTRILVLHADI